MHNKTPNQAFRPTISRLSDAMAHTTGYAFKGVARLARDAGVNPSTVSRVLHGNLNPSAALVARLTGAIERELGYHIDPRDLFAEGGDFLTEYICDVTGCKGCLPEVALDEFGDRTPAFEGVMPGRWVCSSHPKGFKKKKGGT